MEDPGMIFVAFILRLIIAMLLVGWIPAMIASSKNRNFFGWWIYGGALFIIALIHALMLKPLDKEKQSENVQVADRISETEEIATSQLEKVL